MDRGSLLMPSSIVDVDESSWQELYIEVTYLVSQTTYFCDGHRLQKMLVSANYSYINQPICGI